MMDVLLWLALGLVAGVLAKFAVFRAVPRNSWHWAGALVTGLLGGVIGGWITDLAGLEATNWLGAAIISFLGAVGILMLIRRMEPLNT